MSQGNREVFLKNEHTFGKAEWFDDLDQIPQPLKQAEQTISSWLNPDQKWHLELFGKLPFRLFPNLFFVYKGENPPLTFSSSFLGLNKTPHLDLTSVLSGVHIPFPVDFGTYDSIHRSYYFSAIDIDPFTFLLKDTSQTPYTVDHVILLPYLKRFGNNFKITDEDPYRLVVNVQLKDQLQLIPEEITEKVSEIETLKEELKGLQTLNQSLERFRTLPPLF